MRAKTRANETPDPRLAAEAIVRALQAAVRRRILRADRATFEWFETSAGRPEVKVDESIVAAFASGHWKQLRALLSRRDLVVRQVAVWAMATTRRPEVVEPMLALLLDQRHVFDHDFAYGAASRIGAPLVKPLERASLSGRGLRRTFAIECLGMVRGNEDAVASLRRIVRRHGFVEGTLNALFNVFHVGAVPIAAPALADDDPAVRMEAMVAVLNGLESTSKPIRVPQRRHLVRRVLAALADPRTWRDGADPWFSLFGWGLEVLELLGARELLAFVRRCRDDGAHADHLEGLIKLERRLQQRTRSTARRQARSATRRSNG